MAQCLTCSCFEHLCNLLSGAGEQFAKAVCPVRNATEHSGQV